MSSLSDVYAEIKRKLDLKKYLPLKCDNKKEKDKKRAILR